MTQSRVDRKDGKAGQMRAVQNCRLFSTAILHYFCTPGALKVDRVESPMFSSSNFSLYLLVTCWRWVDIWNCSFAEGTVQGNRAF